MCGIFGVIGSGAAVKQTIDGLRRLEYRGYDSAGIAAIVNGEISSAKVAGKISALAKKIQKYPLKGNIAIGHTRWATHGVPNIRNAHPHISENIAMVHNGIIENYHELREELTSKGAIFKSDTDSEVILHLIDNNIKSGNSPLDAVQKALKKLQGSYAIAIIFKHKNVIIAARLGSPLSIGFADGATFISSDILALSPYCAKITNLIAGDVAEIYADEITIYNRGAQKQPDIIDVFHEDDESSKGEYPHFMLKEIFEQPMVVANSLNACYNNESGGFIFPDLGLNEEEMRNISRINIVACGTSYYAAIIAKYWLEQIAKIPCDVDIASEFRYRQPVLDKNILAIFISQSGETADSLAALQYAKKLGVRTVAMVNSRSNSMAMQADGIINIYAGVEIGVASTKAFSAQLITLSALTLTLAKSRKIIAVNEFKELEYILGTVPDIINIILKMDKSIKQVANHLKNTENMLYMGRGTAFGVALEGALKMKELSYIHAEAYAAGELKHGPLALVDENMPIVVLAPNDDLTLKTISNLQETVARGAKIILLSDTDNISKLRDDIFAAIQMPACHKFIAPIIYAVALQLLAYHSAVIRGTNVDQPRNLAKSVTVE